MDKMDKVHIKRHDTTVFFATSKMMPAMVIKKCRAAVFGSVLWAHWTPSYVAPWRKPKDLWPNPAGGRWFIHVYPLYPISSVISSVS